MYNSAISNSNWDVQKPLAKVEYLNIPNVVNIKVDEFIKQQPHGGQITYYLRKTLIESGKIISNNELFQQV